MQNYRIFINHSTVFIGDRKFIESQEERIRPEDEVRMTAVINDILNNAGADPVSVGFVAEHPVELFRKFRKHFKVIKAAGGVVFNNEGQLLLIKRLGMWDLPKGKLEKGEDTRLAALREVHEECGLNFLGILKKIDDSYHVYFLKGRWILKKTTWFKMAALGSHEVSPQIEEDITEVRWVEKSFLKSEDFKTYDSLKYLISKIEFPKQIKK